MRVLFTTLPGSGHWQPLIPFANALQQAGYEVAFATTPSACAAISALGVRCFPAGTDETDEEGQARRAKMAAMGAESAPWAIPSLFAGTWAADRLPDLVSVCQDWKPAVLVREDMDFAGCIAAEQCGLPHATIQVTARRPWIHPLLVAPLNRLLEGVGLPPDPELVMLHRFLLIVPGPPELSGRYIPAPADGPCGAARCIRPLWGGAAPDLGP